MEIIIDDIADVLAVSDAKKILDHYYHEGKGSDPVLHFYETFLSIYDPATRENAGVYYTPNRLSLLLSVRFIKYLKRNLILQTDLHQKT